MLDITVDIGSLMIYIDGFLQAGSTKLLYLAPGQTRPTGASKYSKGRKLNGSKLTFPKIWNLNRNAWKIQSKNVKTIFPFRVI